MVRVEWLKGQADRKRWQRFPSTPFRVVEVNCAFEGFAKKCTRDTRSLPVCRKRKGIEESSGWLLTYYVLRSGN